MAKLKAVREMLRGLKIILFFALLLVFFVIGLVLVFRSGQNKTTEGSLLFGTRYVSEAQGSDWLQRNLLVDQQTEPFLTLLDGDTIDVEIGGGSYHELGYTAVDAYGRDLETNVSAAIDEDGQRLVYTVSDAMGNTATASRSIRYVDTTPPLVTLTGGEEYHIPVGVDYVEPGFTAVDNSDGDVTESVQVSGTVDQYKVGVYPISYTVSDSKGNSGTVIRNVYRDPQEIPEDPSSLDKVIYLTFDDGPAMYTEELLDILDIYGVKVTFFVTAQFPDYLDMIGEEYRRGHSVAIHSYTHDFAIYASEETYFDDLNAMQDVIREQTGQETRLVRFPGGSSNTISANYCRGIMTALANDLEDMGYQYFDWNVSSGDAGSTTDTHQVYENVINDITGNGAEPNVVLQHDIKDFSIAAVEDIILWGLENGYTFLPLNVTSPTAHHGISN